MFRFFSDSFRLTINADTALMKLQKKFIEPTIAKINDFIGSLKKPGPIFVHLKANAVTRFDGGRSIFLEINFLNRLKFFRNKALQGVLAHEYGHTIFDANGNDHILGYQDLLASHIALKNAEYITEQDAVKQEILVALLKKGISHFGWIFIYEELPKLAEQQIRENPKNKTQAEMKVYLDHIDSSKILQIQSPYGELFADLVAVLALDDPRMGQSKSFGKDGRDFSLNLQPKDMTLETPHEMLSAVRSYLWNELITSQKLSKEHILSVVLKASINRINESLKNPSWELDPIQVNIEMIEEINRLLAEGF